MADSASNIVVQRLTELNSALTKAKAERINKEALYNQLKAVESAGALDTFPSVLANDYVQKLKADLSELQRQQQQLAERYGPRHQEVIKNRAAIESADAKLKIEQSKVVDAVKNEFMTALNEEKSLQAALDAQKSEALSQNRKGIEYGVLQREVDSNRQIYDSLMQRTKETGITSEQRASNVRIVDPAETPRGPISPNIQRDLTVTFGFSLLLAVGLAFLFEYLDNRIRTPQEMKAYLDVPFLGMVPAVGKMKDGSSNPLLNGAGIPANFSESFKTVRTNVLFSSAEEGLRTVVVTSAGPGEGKSIVAANLAIALSQAGQRVLLIDADMRRPRVHEIFGNSQEPGLSNVLTAMPKRPRRSGERRPTVCGCSTPDTFRQTRRNSSDRGAISTSWRRSKPTSIGRSSIRRRCWSSPIARSRLIMLRVSCSSSPRTRRIDTPHVKQSSSCPDRTPGSSDRFSIESISSSIRTTTRRTTDKDTRSTT